MSRLIVNFYDQIGLVTSSINLATTKKNFATKNKKNNISYHRIFNTFLTLKISMIIDNDLSVQTVNFIFVKL
jgi:hypothetical protein